jgi:hypothetical protein
VTGVTGTTGITGPTGTTGITGPTGDTGPFGPNPDPLSSGDEGTISQAGNPATRSAPTGSAGLSDEMRSQMTILDYLMGR